MKLLGFLQMYNEVEKGNLRQCLNSMSKYCDDIVIYDDGSTDDSVNVAKEYTNYIIEGKQNDFTSELYHKQELLNFALTLEPDWIIWLDVDEIIEFKGECGELRKLCRNPGDFDSFAFREINLWRCDSYYRIDSQYNSGIFCRLWKNNGKLKFNTIRQLHQRQSPLGLVREGMSDLKVIHYGFSSDINIIRKYNTYKSHGQTGWALNRLIDERTLRVRRVNPKWFNKPIEFRNKEEVYKIPIAAKVLQ